MSFLDKFSSSSPSRHAGDGGDIRSILRNLNNVLNTRQGYGSFLKDFGVRDMNEYSSRDFLAQAVLEDVKQVIEKYEPRVKLLNIETVNSSDPFSLSFKIDCVLKDDPRQLRLIFDSIHNDFRWDRQGNDD